MSEHHRLEVSEVGDVTVVRFIDRKILDAANIQELGEFVSSLENVKDMSILSYHKGGVEKSKRLLRPKDYSSAERIPSAESLKDLEKKLKEFGLKVELGG